VRNFTKLGLVLAIFGAGCSQPAKSEPLPAEAPAPVAAPAKIGARTPPPPIPSVSSSGSEPVLEPITPERPFLVSPGGQSSPAARAQRILHVGDSMVPLVANYLRPIVERRGGSYDIVSVEATRTLDWGGTKRLMQQAMERHDPELILISLGSNELYESAPAARAPDIRQIVADTRGRPCVWISPPAWTKDFGFLEVVRKNLGHCRYFDSTRLKLSRRPDGRHPTWSASYSWASSVWKALGGTESVPTGTPRKI